MFQTAVKIQNKYVSIIINDEILQKLRILLIQLHLFHLPLLILSQ